MSKEPMTAQDLTEIFKDILEKDERIKVCYKFQTNKALQVQLNNGDNFNVIVIKLDEKAHIIKRNSYTLPDIF